MMPLVLRNQKIILGICSKEFITLIFKTMEKQIEKKYCELQEQNIELTMKKLSNQHDNKVLDKQILINRTLLTKLKQMKEDLETIPMSNY